MKTPRGNFIRVGIGASFIALLAVPVRSQTSTTTPPPASPAPSGAVAAAATPVTAPAPTGATGAPTPPVGTMAAIVVTGSDIPTTDATDGPSPLQIISSDQIAQRGDTTLSDVLQHLPETGSFSNAGIGEGGSFNGGGAFVSLKGLGPQATLVLINGRRTTSFGDTANGQYAFVDLNSISVATIDHIEVLTDGASAIYGSDAIAGVVNIILKKDLGGADAETNAYVGNTLNHDAFEQSYSQSFGLSSLDKNGNGIVTVDFYDRNAIFDRDRKYALSPNLTFVGGADLRSSRTFPGVFMGTLPGTPEGDNGMFGVQQNGGALTAASPNEIFDIDPATGYPTTSPPYNYNADSTLVPKTTRYGVSLNYDYNLYDGNVVPNIDFTWRHIHTMFQQAPTGYVDSDNATQYPGNGIPVPVTNPYNLTGQEIDIYSYRFLDVGDRTLDETTDNFRAVPSVKVKLGDDWVMNAALNWSYSFTSDLNGGSVSVSKLNAALASTDPATAYNPFSNVVGANSAAVVNSITQYDPTSNYSSSFDEDIGFTGPLITLPAGPAELAIGAEHRSDRFNQNFSPADQAGDILSESAVQDTAAAREINSGYAELHIPILGKGFNFPGADQFDVWGAVRCDSYNDFGTTINPEARFRWKPVKDLVVRGSFSTGFRAPSLPELYAGGNQSFQFVNDPVQGTEPEVTVNGGGNAELKPETSENYNLGVVYTPDFVPGMTINADIWKIRYYNQIQQLNIQDLVDSGSPLVHRDALGDITSITSPYENIANNLIQGIDLGMTYIWGDPAKTWGQFTFTVNGTFLLNDISQSGPGQPYQELAGTDSQGMGAYPRYRQTATVAWDYRTFEFSVSNDYTSQVNDTEAIDSNYNPTPYHRIDSYFTWDLQASYSFEEGKHDYISPKGDIDWMSWLDGSKISVGCDNVMDFTPPLTLSQFDDPVGTDANYADYRGRFVYMAIKKTF